MNEGVASNSKKHNIEGKGIRRQAQESAGKLLNNSGKLVILQTGLLTSLSQCWCPSVIIASDVPQVNYYSRFQRSHLLWGYLTAEQTQLLVLNNLLDL